MLNGAKKKTLKNVLLVLVTFINFLVLSIEVDNDPDYIYPVCFCSNKLNSDLYKPPLEILIFFLVYFLNGRVLDDFAII